MMFRPSNGQCPVVPGRHWVGLLVLAVGLVWYHPAVGAETATAESRAVLLISIDGLRPDYVAHAEEHGLQIPRLRRLLREGAHASGVQGVLPSTTYPSHTTLVTGVAPATHGIGTNRPFTSDVKNFGVYYSFAEDINVPTLWDAAAGAGLKVGSVSWPVSVGSRSIHFNIPEYHLTRTDEDVKITRGLATPGLMRELSAKAGEFITDNKKSVPRDWARTRYTLGIIREKRPQLITVHLAATDHYQHRDGPFTPRTKAALEEIDRMVGELTDAMREVYPRAIVCVASDHGFAAVNRYVHLDAAFVRAGLITLKTPGATINESGIQHWIARAYSSSGSAAVVLRDPHAAAARAKVKSFLDEFAASPENGVAGIYDEVAIRDLGGTPLAHFWIDLRPGWQIAPALAPSIAAAVSGRGTHGYGPDHPEMNSAFIIAGEEVKSGFELGLIDMRAIAPTLAKALAIPLPTAEVPPLPVFMNKR